MQAQMDTHMHTLTDNGKKHYAYGHSTVRDARDIEIDDKYYLQNMIMSKVVIYVEKLQLF